MQTLGEKWSLKLATELPKIANTLRVERRLPGSRCPGAFDPDNGEFDPKQDRDYHAAHPEAPPCVAGLVGAEIVVKSILGLHLPNMRDAEMADLGLGPLPMNGALLICDRNQKLAGITRYEFPLRSEIWWLVKEGHPRHIEISNISMVQLAVAVKE